MQEIVDETPDLRLTPQSHKPGIPKNKYIINFGQIYLSQPAWTEVDGITQAMLPNEARLRSLTYSAPLYVDIKKTTIMENGTCFLFYKITHNLKLLF